MPGFEKLNPGPEYKVEDDERSQQDVHVQIRATRRAVGALSAICDPVPPSSLHRDNKRLSLWAVLALIGISVRINDRCQPTVFSKAEQPRGTARSRQALPCELGLWDVCVNPP